MPTESDAQRTTQAASLFSLERKLIVEKKEASYDWEFLQAQSKQANFYFACTLSRLQARARLLTHALSSPSCDDAPCSALQLRGASSAAAGKHKRKQEVLEALIALDRSSFGCAVSLGGGSFQAHVCNPFKSILGECFEALFSCLRGKRLNRRMMCTLN